MSKPDDIPQEAWDAAQPFVVEQFGGNGPTVVGFQRTRVIIARAVMAATAAERDACAQLAQAEADRTSARMDPTLLDRMIHVDSAWRMCADTSAIIRNAIRKRGEATQ